MDPITFTQFINRECPSGYYILTLHNRAGDKEIALALCWEAINAKWYAPDPDFGRHEVGYTDDLHLRGENWTIDSVRELRAGVLQ